MAESRTVANRFTIPRSGLGVVVAAGDVLGITALVSYGLLRHNTPGLFQSPTYAASRILPFVVAWLLVATVAGLFGDDILRDTRATVARTVVAWTGAAALGAGIRAVATTGGASPVFVGVMIGVGLVVMLPWRVGAAVVAGR